MCKKVFLKPLSASIYLKIFIELHMSELDLDFKLIVSISCRIVAPH